MWQWILDLTGVDAVFFGCAAVGGSLFLIRVALATLGFGDADGDADFDMDGDADLSVGDAMGDGDMTVGLLSFTGLTSFFMMFGLTGLAMRIDEGAGTGLSIAVAAGVGLVTVWIVSQLFKVISRLRSSGNIDPANAVGVNGRVYLTIPPGGRGQVELSVQERTRVMDAMAEHPVELKTGTSVRVVRIVEGNVVVVEKV